LAARAPPAAATVGLVVAASVAIAPAAAGDPAALAVIGPAAASAAIGPADGPASAAAGDPAWVVGRAPRS